MNYHAYLRSSSRVSATEHAELEKNILRMKKYMELASQRQANRVEDMLVNGCFYRGFALRWLRSQTFCKSTENPARTAQMYLEKMVRSGLVIVVDANASSSSPTWYAFVDTSNTIGPTILELWTGGDRKMHDKTMRGRKCRRRGIVGPRAPQRLLLRRQPAETDHRLQILGERVLQSGYLTSISVAFVSKPRIVKDWFVCIFEIIPKAMHVYHKYMKHDMLKTRIFSSAGITRRFRLKQKHRLRLRPCLANAVVTYDLRNLVAESDLRERGEDVSRTAPSLEGIPVDANDYVGICSFRSDQLHFRKLKHAKKSAISWLVRPAMYVADVLGLKQGAKRSGNSDDERGGGRGGGGWRSRRGWVEAAVLQRPIRSASAPPS
eukprot:g4464.t1